jgi:hypothetical protein
MQAGSVITCNILKNASGEPPKKTFVVELFPEGLVAIQHLNEVSSALVRTPTADFKIIHSHRPAPTRPLEVECPTDSAPVA